MNRRNFLKLSLLVLPALATNLEVSGEKFKIISPSETFNKAFEKMPEAFLEGYEMGQKVMEGYAEGVQGLPWGEMPEGLETIEVEWSGKNVHLEQLGWPNPDNYDPIADLQAIVEYALSHRGI
jgi:hypothetical protein